MQILARFLRHFRDRDRFRVRTDVDGLAGADERRDVGVELLAESHPLLVGRERVLRGEGGEEMGALVGAVDADGVQAALVFILEGHEEDAVVRRAELRRCAFLREQFRRAAGRRNDVDAGFARPGGGAKKAVTGSAVDHFRSIR